MPDDPVRSSKRVLEPYDRISEVLFGLVMVLTFTGALSVADAGRDDVRLMLIGALGCNLAWGIIDGVLYLMGSLAERGAGLTALRAVRRATSSDAAREAIAGALPAVIASVLEPAEYDAIHKRLNALPEPAGRARLRKNDWLGAVGVFLLVFLSTIPVIIPFTFIDGVKPAMRISNAIAIVMLLVTGVAFGQLAGRRPWAMGIAMVVFGTLLVAMTIALGG